MMTVEKFVNYCKAMEDKFGIKVPSGIDPDFLAYIVDRMTSLTAAAQVVRPTRCTHCGKDIHTVGSVLEAINFACGGGTPANPEMRINGFGIWFRGYMLTDNHIDLTGLCVAFPTATEFNKKDSAYRIVIPTGGDWPLTVQLVKRWQPIDLGYNPGTFCEDILVREDALDILVAAKKRAMQFLKEHVEALPMLD